MRDWQLAASPSYGASAFYWLAASLVAQDNSEELLAASCSWRRQISQLDKESARTESSRATTKDPTSHNEDSEQPNK